MICILKSAEIDRRFYNFYSATERVSQKGSLFLIFNSLTESTTYVACLYSFLDAVTMSCHDLEYPKPSRLEARGRLYTGHIVQKLCGNPRVFRRGHDGTSICTDILEFSRQWPNKCDFFGRHDFGYLGNPHRGFAMDYRLAHLEAVCVQE